MLAVDFLPAKQQLGSVFIKEIMNWLDSKIGTTQTQISAVETLCVLFERCPENQQAMTLSDNNFAQLQMMYQIICSTDGNAWLPSFDNV